MRQERDTSRRRNETYGQLVRVGFAVAGFAPPAYRRGSLPRPLNGDLISEGASRLDAFSAYHFRTWLPGGAADRTVSRRSEPSSRATLIGEQPNPWDLLQPQDVTSRHRGAKPPRRSELLGAISLLSPEYLLSFERRPFHTEPPDHFALLSHLVDLSVSQSSALMPMHSTHGCHSC